MQTIAAALVAAVVLVAAVLGIGAWRWSLATAALHEQLQAGNAAPAPSRVDLRREVHGLPAPVQRYFRAALTDGAPMVSGASVTHRGSFNMGSDPKAPHWKPFESRQAVTTRPPGFVWDASVEMAPGIAARVHDAYVAGEGRLHATVAGLVTVAEQHGSDDMDRGELMRWFAEAAWYPTALLPSQGVRWTAIDERAAMATLRDGDIELSLRFTFGDDHLIRSVHADARGRAIGDRILPTPWAGRWSNHQWREGMRVPVDGEVAWLLTEGELPYWRGTITSIEYDFAR
jgi:hypothetical protein